MMFRRILATCALVTALAVTLGAVAGCSDESPATGTLVVQLTDAPFPYDMIALAKIAVDGVEVHVKAQDETQSGFQVLSEVPAGQAAPEYSLLDLSNGQTALLGVAELPVGEIDQMRLIVSSASVVLTDMRTFDLNVPSGSSSGLKVFFDPPIRVEGGQERSVLLDVDVSRSFSSIPASPTQVGEIVEFKFHPEMRVAVMQDTGTLSGRVASSTGDTPIAKATVSLWENGAAITSTATDDNGEWKMLGIEPGTKIVRAEALGFTAEQTTATAIAGTAVTGVDFALNSAP